MEDAATAEISRSQIWQWIHNQIKLDDGRLITKQLVETLADEEIAKLEGNSKFEDALKLFKEVQLAMITFNFLTLAYEKMA
jgi:malate synthase